MLNIKKTLRIGIVIIFIPFGGIFCFLMYLPFGGYMLIDKKETAEFVTRIQSSPELPKQFYQMYNLMYSHSLDGGQ